MPYVKCVMENNTEVQKRGGKPKSRNVVTVDLLGLSDRLEQFIRREQASVGNVRTVKKAEVVRLALENFLDHADGCNGGDHENT